MLSTRCGRQIGMRGIHLQDDRAAGHLLGCRRDLKRPPPKSAPGRPEVTRTGTGESLSHLVEGLTAASIGTAIGVNP